MRPDLERPFAIHALPGCCADYDFSYVIVDTKDECLLRKFNYIINAKGYAVRWTRIQGKPCQIYLHRDIMGNPKGKDIHHINGDRRDNRRGNLKPMPKHPHEIIHINKRVAVMGHEG